MVKFITTFEFINLCCVCELFKLDFAYELAKFGKKNIVLMTLFTKCFDYFWFYMISKFGKKLDYL